MPITTIPSLDKMIWGIKRRELTVVAGRTSMGKSAFMNQLAWDLAGSKMNVLYLSLEMDVSSLQERLFCNVCSVHNFELIKGAYSTVPGIQRKWKEFEGKVEDRRLEYCDYIGHTWKQIDDTLQGLHTKPDVVVLDHINEIMSANVKDRRHVIDDYILHLREMSVRDNFALILGAQINRMGQTETNKEPQLHQIKESGGVEQVCDLAMLLWWPYKENENNPKHIYKVNVAKNRNGWTGHVKIKYEPEYYRFSDLSPEEQKPKTKPPEQRNALDD